MARVRKKSISFDAMVKFFMQTYKIPTTNDVDRLEARLDRLERLIKQQQATGRRRGAGKGEPGTGDGREKSGETFTDKVMEVIVTAREGVGVADIQAQTGFDAKKIRNIIFRLGKENKIKRVSRGMYTAA
jgi:hypothetical protein